MHIKEALFWSWIHLFIFSCLTSLIHSEMKSIPAPQNLSMNSINMNHMLIWSPVIVPNMEVNYTVEAQGEFERSLMPHNWIPMCESINATLCNITDLAADVYYIVRVRAEIPNSTSDWAFIIFNPNNTHLTTPSITVKAEERALIVTFDPLETSFPKEDFAQYILYYWKTDNKNLVHNRTITRNEYSERVEDDEEGAEYCFQGQIYVEIISRASNYSEIVCAKVHKTSPFWIIGSVIIVICLFTAFFALFSFTSLIRKICQLIKYSCCPQIEIPNALIIDFLPPAEARLQNIQRNDVCEAVYILIQNGF